jgi:hypothetical protein
MSVDLSTLKSWKNVSFGSKTVFGSRFQPGIKNAIGVVGSLLNTGALRLEGSIDPSDVSKIRKHQIWSYIYYLWYYNRDKIEIFEKMSNYEGKKAKATAKTFLTSFYDMMDKTGLEINSSTQLITIFNKERIVDTLNKILEKYPDISIPVLQKLYKKLINSGKIPGLEKVSSSQLAKANIQVIPNANQQPNIPNIELKMDQFQVKSNDNYIVKVNDKSQNSNIKVQFGINLVPKN